MLAPLRVAVAAMLVTPLAVSMLVGDEDVVGGGGNCVTVSGMVVLSLLVTFGKIGLTVGSNVGSVVGGTVTSETVVPGIVVSGVDSVWDGSVAVALPLPGGLVGSMAVLVGSGVVVGSIAVPVGSLEGEVTVGILVSVVLEAGGGMTVVGWPVGSSVAGGVVSATVELPVPGGRSVNERLIPMSEEVGSGNAVVGSCVAVAVGCSVSGVVGEAEADGSVGCADAEGVTVGSADGDAGSSDVGVDVVGSGAAVSVTFGEGRMALVTSETTLLSIELIGARGSLNVGEGSLVLVTIPVGARSMAVVLVDSTDDSAEENRPDEVGSADGLAVSDEAASEATVDAVGATASVAVSVGEADTGTTGSELVGSMMVAGMPPVEATPAASLELSLLGAEAVTGLPTELTGVGSVEGGTTIVLSTTIVVTCATEPELESPKSVVSAELLASELVLMNVGLSVKVGLFKLAKRSLIESRLVVSGASSNGVDCETGDSVVMLTLLYCRFR